MPPIKRRRTTGAYVRRTASRPRRPRMFRSSGKKRKVSVKSRPRNYSRAKKSSMSSMIPLRTLTPKEFVITIPYRQTLFFTNMGSAAWTRPIGVPASGRYLCSNVILVNMTDPYSKIVSKLLPDTVLNSSESLNSNPVYTLAEQLDPYFETHEAMCVTASSVSFNATQTPNQAKLDLIGNVAAKGSQYFGTTAGTASYADNHMPYMTNTGPTYNGNVYAAMIKHRFRGTEFINDDTIPIGATNATLHALKTEVPGIRMKNVLCSPTTTKNVKMVTTYTPGNAWGGTKWRQDEELTFTKPMQPAGDPARPNGAPTKGTVAAFGLFAEAPPGTEGVAVTPTFKVEIQINYRIRMIRRKQTFSGNSALSIPVHIHSEL